MVTEFQLNPWHFPIQNVKHKVKQKATLNFFPFMIPMLLVQER